MNIWDERFHALVAKNLIEHPLKPTLYNEPILNIPYDRWDKAHIWLHKQPLFLWQIALSFKLFGISEFSLRLPSVILSTILVLITYRCGKLLINSRVGYIASLLLISSSYLIELIAGRQTLEHNDIAFLSYISLSFWSLIEYYFSKNKYWILLIGLFSGMAILCKWLIGLIVYFGWLFIKIQNKDYVLKKQIDIILSFVITIIVALPWQIISFIWYPAETYSINKYNALHFTKILEGHGGDFWYHFNQFNIIYGNFASFLIIPSMIILYKNIKDKKIYYSILGIISLVYLFFSIAATKMPSFTIIVSMFVFIAFASLLNYIFNYINNYINYSSLKSVIFATTLIIITILKINIEKIQEIHTLWKPNNSYSRMLSENKRIFKSLKLSEEYVLFNLKGTHYIEAMFYTDLTSYNFIPSLEQYNFLKSKNCKIAIFNSEDLIIPYYLKNDKDVIIIDEIIQGYQ